MRIVSLELGHEAALALFEQDFRSASETRIPGWFCPPGMPHAEKVAMMARQHRGEGLQQGHVPATTWFAEEEGELLGVINVRHRLNDFLESYGAHAGYAVRPSARGRGVAKALLRHAREQCRALGLEVMVLTTDPENLSSQGVILALGGVVESEYFLESVERRVRRFNLPTPRDS